MGVYERTGDQYLAGRPWANCDRCGLQYRHDELRKEWTGLLVCASDYDPKPADMSPPNYRPDGLPIHNPRPDPDAVTISEVNTTTAADL
jgi:hypothetical protein